MDSLTAILETLKYIVPMAFVGAFMWYFFKKYTDAEDKRRAQEHRQNSKSESSAIRFQAYERMALLLERMSLHSLVGRIKPYNTSVADYSRLLVDHIDQEFEFNLSQQVYISNQGWEMIKTAKKQTQALIPQLIKDSKAQDIALAQQYLIVYSTEHVLPSEKALDFIKDELRKEF